MVANRDAYDRIRSAIAAANLGFSNARTASDGAVFLDLYHKLDDELDEMIANNLSKSDANYKVLTNGLKKAKSELEDVVENIQKFIDDTAVALKIATFLMKVVAIL